MGVKDIYQIKTRNVPDTWNVYKADGKFNVSGEVYQLEKGPGSKLTCTCPGGSRTYCRHMKMLPIFRAEEAIDTNRWYSFDQQKWFTDHQANEGV